MMGDEGKPMACGLFGTLPDSTGLSSLSSLLFDVEAKVKLCHVFGRATRVRSLELRPFYAQAHGGGGPLLVACADTPRANFGICDTRKIIPCSFLKK